MADGASLWVAGKSAAEYKQAAKFVAFLLSPEMQVELVRAYGGLPLTGAARAAARSKILQDGDKTLEIAYASIDGGQRTRACRRCADTDAVRIMVNEELEAVWSDQKPAKAAPRYRRVAWQCRAQRQAGPEEGAALLMQSPLPRWIAHRSSVRWRREYPGRHPLGGPPGFSGRRSRCGAAVGGRHAVPDP